MKIIAFLFAYFNFVLLPIFRRFKAFILKTNTLIETKKIINQTSQNPPPRAYPPLPDTPQMPPFSGSGCYMRILT